MILPQFLGLNYKPIKSLKASINDYSLCLRITEQDIFDTIYKTMGGINQILQRTINEVNARLRKVEETDNLFK